MKRHLARVTAAVKTEGKHANYARKYEKWLKKKIKGETDMGTTKRTQLQEPSKPFGPRCISL